MAKRRVILYGRSVILGTLGASLALYPELEVIPLSPPLPSADKLSAIASDTIIFDMRLGRPKAAFAVLQTLSNLTLIGMNPNSDQVELWISGQERAGTTMDLVKIISSETRE